MIQPIDQHPPLILGRMAADLGGGAEASRLVDIDNGQRVDGAVMVAAPFGGDAAGYGVLGVIGPVALRYDTAIPLVRRVARLASLASTRL